MEDGTRHGRQLAQRSDRKQVRRHQKGKDAGIVRWPESGGNQSDRLHRVSKSLFAKSFGGGRSGALKVVGSEFMLALLFAHGPDYHPHRVTPLRIEWLRSSGLLPVAVRQPDRITQRIQFILPLPHARLHLGLVLTAPFEGWSIQVRHEGIGIGIDEDMAGLP